MICVFVCVCVLFSVSLCNWPVKTIPWKDVKYTYEVWLERNETGPAIRNTEDLGTIEARGVYLQPFVIMRATCRLASTICLFSTVLLEIKF